MILFFCLCVLSIFSESNWNLIGGETDIDIGGEYVNAPLFPGPRTLGANWAHFNGDGTSGALYMFGGFGCTTKSACSDQGNGTFSHDYVADLWRFDIDSGMWSLPALGQPCGGTCILQERIIFPGRKYDYSPLPGQYHWPSSRGNMAKWTWNRDTHSEFFMFGGYGYYKWIEKVENNETVGYAKYGYFNGLWSYSTVGDNWRYLIGDQYCDMYSTKAGEGLTNYTMPGARTGSTTWRHGGKYYMHGGYGFGGMGGGPGRLTDLWSFFVKNRAPEDLDEPAAEWALVKGPEDHNVGGLYATEYGSRNNPGGRDNAIGWVETRGGETLLYLYGGTHSNGQSVSDVFAFSLKEKKWRWVKEKYGLDVPPQRDSFAAWYHVPSHTEYLFVFGGYRNLYKDKSRNSYLNDFWVFHSDFNQWEKFASCCCKESSGSYDVVGLHPPRRLGAQSWVVGDKFYLFGGEGHISVPREGVGRFNDFWEYSFDESYEMVWQNEKLGPGYVVLYVLLVLFGVVLTIAVIAGLIVCIVCGIVKYMQYDESEDAGGKDSDDDHSSEEELV